jgi:membrane-associated phospholipid phosphatase
MISLLTACLLAASLPDDGVPPPSHAVSSVDGGVVPIVAPPLTNAVAKIIAPELVQDGGMLADGGVQPVLAPPSLSVYEVDLPSEIAITGGALGLSLMVDVAVKPSLQGDLSCRGGVGPARCDPATLSAFDRYAVGKNSQEWDAFSNIELFATLAMPVLYLGLESLVLPTKTPWGDFLTDLVVVAESMALTASITTILKFSFRRPRPGRYLPVDQPVTADDELSLPSGHVSEITAATVALTTTIFLRHPSSKIRFAAVAATVVLSTLSAIARVEAGKHFPTDVITGVVVGAFSGFVVPYLHRKKSPLVPSASFNPANGGTVTLGVSGHW